MVCIVGIVVYGMYCYVFVMLGMYCCTFSIYFPNLCFFWLSFLLGDNFPPPPHHFADSHTVLFGPIFLDLILFGRLREGRRWGERGCPMCGFLPASGPPPRLTWALKKTMHRFELCMYRFKIFMSEKKNLLLIDVLVVDGFNYNRSA